MGTTLLNNTQTVFLLGSSCFVPLQDLGVAQNAVEGSAEFMAHVSQKLTFGIISCIRSLFSRLQLSRSFLNPNF